MAAGPVVEERHLRADAQRNLGRILDAARAVFAEQGVEASVADVAERAGVGTATIFRRFPTKDDLLAAVVEERVGQLAELARTAARSTDPRKGLRKLMSVGIETYLRDRGLCEATGTAVYERPRVRELKAEAAAAIEELLDRAKEAGAVRSDVTATDVSMLFFALASAAQKQKPAARRAWHRYLDIVLDGLRPQPS